MKTLKYTPRIITLLSAGKKLEAIKEAKDTYGLTVLQAKNMINAYGPGDTYYFLPFELAGTSEAVDNKVEISSNSNCQQTEKVKTLWLTKINVVDTQEIVKIVKNAIGCNYKDAKDLVDNLPSAIMSDEDWKMKSLERQLKSAGCNIEYRGEESSKQIQSSNKTNNISSTQSQTSSNTDVIPFCCPNCGSEQVKKSIGGKLEQVAALGVTKAIKSYVLGDYGGLTGGAENEILKETVPFQQVCKYCHQTFHASLAQIASGKYAMDKNKAEKLKDAYNGKLQIVKDNEVEEIREKGSKSLKRAFLAGITLVVGLLISANCQHTESGFLGLESYTGTYMFAWVLMLAGGVGVLIEGISSYGSYSEASALDDMSIQEYAKNHSA